MNVRAKVRMGVRIRLRHTNIIKVRPRCMPSLCLTIAILGGGCGYVECKVHAEPTANTKDSPTADPKPDDEPEPPNGPYRLAVQGAVGWVCLTIAIIGGGCGYARM